MLYEEICVKMSIFNQVTDAFGQFYEEIHIKKIIIHL